MLHHCPKSQKNTTTALKRGLFVAGVVLSGLYLFNQSVLAQAQPDVSQESSAMPNLSEVVLTAMPPRLGDDGSIVVKPGEKLQIQVRVRNTSTQPIPVLTSVQDFILAEDGETPIPVTDSVSNRWSVASWLTLVPTENIIRPKQTIGINVLIEVPEDALPGGRYAMILHTPNTQGAAQIDQAEGQSSSAVSQKVGTLLYIIVDGPINEEAFVRNFSFPKFTEYGPVPFSFEVENLSDVHIAPQTSIEIFNLFNQKVDVVQIPAKNVFPFTTRGFEGQWNKTWGIGLYTARLTMSFGSTGSVVLATTNFWLLPIKIVIAVVALSLIFIILIFAIRKHLKHRRKQDEELIAELQGKIESLGMDDHAKNTDSDTE